MSYKETAGCGFVLAVEGTKPKFYVKTSAGWLSATGSTDVPLNQWVHLAGTYDGGNIVVYMNGAAAGTTPATGAMTSCTGYTAVGSRNSFDQHWFPGAIDDVWIFNTGLASDRIARALFVCALDAAAL